MATTKNEMTQIKAIRTIQSMIKDGSLVVAEDVAKKIDEIEVAMSKKKNRTKKVSDIDVQNTELIEDYLTNLGKGATVTEILHGANLLDENGLPLSTSKVTSLLKGVNGIQRIVSGKKSLYSVQ